MRILLINNEKEQAQETDEILMQRYALGDFAAFEQLYQRHKGGLYRYFLRQLGNHALAEDLFQDIWSKVISQAPKYKIKAKFSTWLRVEYSKLPKNALAKTKSQKMSRLY